jgi:FAD/FMN-containing dehydrogenase/Fe-S oxidoreductase
MNDREAHVDRLVAALGAAVRGQVDASRRRRAEYSSDASNYRVVPAVVVFPRDVEDILAATEVARREGTPLTMRGGGTSIAGNAIGPGIVVDTSRHLRRVLDVDPEAATARVEPGVVLADLQAAAAPYGLRFGPDPSTGSRATLGGMIGNNACGAHTVAYGRTADNVLALDVIDGTGHRFVAAQGLEPVAGLAQFVAQHGRVMRDELGRFSRQISGYALEHLLPERGSDLAKALVGTEGTAVTVLEATVRLVREPTARALVVLGYPTMADAADAVPALLAHDPLAVEGIDARLVDVVRRHRGAGAVPDLPAGGGWLLVEVGGPSPTDAHDRADQLIADAAAVGHRLIRAPAEAATLWGIRADGAGLSGRTPAGTQAWPGWEDAAVPPDRLGAYLRAFDALMESYSLDGLPYGHFGDGCVHVRIDFPLDTPATVGTYRAFMLDAARLVVAHGGSLSGEHGDGRARSELLPLQYSKAAIDTFAAFKRLLDPCDLLNPGVVVRPRQVTADLRRPRALPLAAADGFAFSADEGDVTAAVHRCVGVGKCRADLTDAGGFMCPSYLATRDERDSTRGRARVLQEMTRGSLVADGWRSAEVHEALDLCLSCKACATDCPAGVDMATYKSEVLHRTYRRRLRPRSHYALGWLPQWARLVAHAPGLVNRVLALRPVARLVLAAGGVDPRRTIPRFAPTRRRRRSQSGRPGGAARPARAPVSGAGDAPGQPVVVWLDSFTRAFAPDVATAATTVLSAAGYRPVVADSDACCGLTWISTGQLRGARRRLRRLLDALAPHAAAGAPIVGLEPSCTATLRSDLPELLPDDPRATVVADAVHTLAELLTAAPPTGPVDMSVPDLAGTSVVRQPHCHQHAVTGDEADRVLLRRTGAAVTTLAGCCGLAGNFGMERGHYELSVAVAETALLPALRRADPSTVFLADGFSCRTQAEDLIGVRGMHLAQLLAGAWDHSGRRPPATPPTDR